MFAVCSNGNRYSFFTVALLKTALDLLRRRIETMRLELRQRLRSKTHGRYPPPGPGDRPYWEPEAGRVARSTER